MDTSGVFRNLAISYEAVGRYEDALNAAEHAVKVRAEPKSDEYLLCAFARASAATGDCSGADAALRVIAERKPSVRSTALFSDAVDFVLSKDRCGGKLGK